ncbi:Receptor expression-enhancing protein 2 [Collichthys lucidus]|uniref:Receptor expression-enhancing protein n=1 Tax=Collichthys lucidus TaxID=240159 RepID=A0A4U5UEJ1_COLLU|nr:Receptor expression-enhancing protein 2 [Collichthys lucidus]
MFQVKVTHLAAVGCSGPLRASLFQQLGARDCSTSSAALIPPDNTAERTGSSSNTTLLLLLLLILTPVHITTKPRPEGEWGAPSPLANLLDFSRRSRRPAVHPSIHPSSTMVSWIISRIVVLAFGTLYPAYSSYKAVKTKNVKEYVKWMMYWIVFALFTTAETATDLLLSWFPFYFELKIAFVIWLLSPYTKGSSVLYRKFVHPTLSNKEKEIDEYIAQAKDRSYETMMRFGKRGLNLAANAAVTAATKGQGVLSDKLRSFSMQDLTLINADDDLALHTSDARMRRDPMDDMSSGASTLPRAKSTTSRQTRSFTNTSLADDAASQHSSDQSDTRTEHSDEDVAEKAPKRVSAVKTTKKPAAAKTEASSLGPYLEPGADGRNPQMLLSPEDRQQLMAYTD